MVSRKSKWFNAWTELATSFRERHFSLKNNGQAMVIPIWVLGYHYLGGKWTKEPYNSKENNSRLLIPMTKFKLSSGNVKFKKLVFTDLSLTASQCLNTVLMRWVMILTVWVWAVGRGLVFFLQLCRVQDFPEWLQARASPAGLEETLMLCPPYVWKSHTARKGNSL